MSDDRKDRISELINAEPNSGHTPLVLALRNKHFHIFKKLIDHGADVNAPSDYPLLHRIMNNPSGAAFAPHVFNHPNVNIHLKDESGNTALHYAAGNVSPIAEDHINKLISMGANVNATNLENKTPLHMAVISRNLNNIKLLLDHGADKNIKTKIEGRDHRQLKYTPAEWARIHGESYIGKLIDDHQMPIKESVESVKHLVNIKNNTDHTPLMKAIKGVLRGDAGEDRWHSIVHKLLVHGANPNDTFSDKNTVLHAAAEHGYHKIAQSLLEHGANPNAENFAKQTPLHKAYDSDMVNLLLKHGANPNAVNDRGDTPLHHVAGITHAVEPLLKAGANPNVRGQYGLSPLDRAISEKHTENAKILIDHGADIHSAGTDGYAPIHRAVSVGGTHIIDHLIKHGADVRAEDLHGNTPLHLAAELDDGDGIIQNLLKHGAKADTPNAEGNLPIHTMANSELKSWHPEKQKETIHSLIDASKHVLNNKNKNGDTPLHLVVRKTYPQSGHREFITHALANGADPNARDKHGNSPLHFPYIVGSIKDFRGQIQDNIVKPLMDAGADEHQKNNDGKSAKDVSDETIASFNKIKPKTTLNEAAKFHGRKTVIRFRSGKRQRRVLCQTGSKLLNGACKPMSAMEKRHRKVGRMRARRTLRTRGGWKRRANLKRQRTLRIRRGQLGPRHKKT